MRLDVGDLVAGRGRDRLQGTDLVGNQVLYLRRLQAGHRPPAEPVQVAIAGVSADADAARLRQLHRVTHDIGVAGMEAAGDVDGGRKLDHGGVVAHFPRAEAFAEVAVQVDRAGHDVRLPWEVFG